MGQFIDFLDSKTNNIDEIDMLALFAGMFVIAMITHVASFNIEVFGGFDLQSTQWTYEGIEISYSHAVYYIALGWILVTNGILSKDGFSLDAYTTAGKIAIGATAVAPLVIMTVPAAQSLVLTHDVVRFALFIALNIGFVLISYES